MSHAMRLIASKSDICTHTTYNIICPNYSAYDISDTICVQITKPLILQQRAVVEPNDQYADNYPIWHNLTQYGLLGREFEMVGISAILRSFIIFISTSINCSMTFMYYNKLLIIYWKVLRSLCLPN